MKQLTLPPVVIADNEVPVICTIRNELTLLPHFFEHYRRLGAGPFIMIDNGSDDGSLDYLLSQDCHVFYTSSSFREARFGINWVNEAVRRFCLGKWFIFVDCDELFVYPNCEFTSIAQFCFDLSRMHYDTVFAFMLDMYPDIPLSQAKLYGMSSVLKEFCWFDTEYIFRRWPRRFWDRPDNIFSLQVIGGPRCRLLSSLDVQANRGAYFYTLCNQVDRFVYYLPRSGVRVLAKMWPVDIPALNKRPLNFASNPHFTFFDNHGSSNTRYAKENGALLHIKLFHELQERFKADHIISNHYRNGLIYEQLRDALLRWGERALVYPGSRKYRTSADLEAVGLIGSSISALWFDQSDVSEIRTGSANAGASVHQATAEPS